MKKFIATLMAVVMMLSLCTFQAAAAEEDLTLTITPNITKADVGTETIKVIYTIKVTPKAGTEVGAFAFTLDAPAGMTLSETKLKTAASNQGGEGYWVASKALKWDDDEETGIFTTFEYTAASKYFAAAGGTSSLNLTSEAVVMTIMATIEAGKSGDFTLNAKNFKVADPLGKEISGRVNTTTVTIANPTVPVTKIELNKTATTLEVGQNETLNVKNVEPSNATDKTVTWSSSDPSVATVDKDGKVIAKKIGTTTITATAKDGSNVSGQCTVTVKAASHDHKWTTAWTYVDADTHKRTCTVDGCTAIDIAAHTGGTATCKSPATCKDCNHQYGATDPKNHAESAVYYDKTATSHTEKFACCNAIKALAAAHNWKNGECTVCEYKCQHEETEVKNAKAATCTEAGYTGDTYCKNCGIKTEDGSTIAATGHTMTKTDAKAPTCAEAGNIEHWTCSKTCCKGKHFDKDGKEITTAVTIPALTHELTKTEAKAATCTETGNIEYWTCSKTCCEGKYFDKDGKELSTIIVAATGHTMTKTEAKAATCTEDGTNAYWTCSACKKVFADAAGKTETSVDKEKLTKLGHDESQTYTSDATGHWQFCKRCGEVINKGVHTWNTDTPAEGTAQFCTTCGYVKQAAKTPCDKHIDGIFACDAKGHYHICRACGAEYDRAAHTFGPETTVNGKKFHTCKECGYTEEIKTVTPPTTPTGNNPNAKNPYTKNDGKKVESGRTFDAGIALYVGLSLLSVTGGALVIGKKKEF